MHPLLPMPAPLVLLVDADEDTRQILRLALEHEGYRVLDAADGDAGLELARGHNPDIVVGDFPVAVMGHPCFTQALRGDGGQFNGTPILTVTARALDEDVALARAVSDEVMLKPVRPVTVVSTVGRLLGRIRG